MRKQGAFLSADAATNLHYDVLVGVRVLGQKHYPKPFLKLGCLGFCTLILLPCKLAEVGIGQELFRLRHTLKRTLVVTVRRNRRLKLFKLLRCGGIRRGGRKKLSARHTALGFEVSVFNCFQFIQHRLTDQNNNYIIF